MEQKIRDIIGKIVNHEQVSMYFNQDPSKVICETGIIMSEKIKNNQLNRIKPDRIVLFEDKTVLMDYKTKYRVKKDADLMNSKDVEQLKEYGEVLKQLYKKPVEKYLVYVEWVNSTVKVIEVD